MSLHPPSFSSLTRPLLASPPCSPEPLATGTLLIWTYLAQASCVEDMGKLGRELERWLGARIGEPTRGVRLRAERAPDLPRPHLRLACQPGPAIHRVAVAERITGLGITVQLTSLKMCSWTRSSHQFHLATPVSTFAPGTEWRTAPARTRPSATNRPRRRQPLSVRPMSSMIAFMVTTAPRSSTPQPMPSSSGPPAYAC